MKNLVIIFILGIIISSCNDITESDPNKISNIVKYTKVLENQETSVIQPLVNGKTWYYLHKYYGSDGAIIKTIRDSMFIEGEYLVGNEKWFKIWHPIFNSFVFMTNTDKGLWYKCQLCDNESYLEAEYPDLISPYFSTKFTVFGMWFDSVQVSHQFWDTCYKSFQILKENVTVPFGKFDAIKYKESLINITNTVDLSPITYTAYYVPNLGLIKLEKYFNNYLNESYELRNNFFIIQNTFNIDFGAFLVGDFKTSNYNILTNLSGNDLKIFDVTVEGQSSSDIIIQNYNKVIPNQSDFLLPIFLNPTKAGTFNDKIKILTDGGDFTVNITYVVR